MNKVNNRIKKIREHFCDDSNVLFAERLGCTPQYASNITKEGKSVGDKVLNKILDEFPTVSPVWLKMGEGAMLNHEPRNVKFYDPEDTPQNLRLIPVYSDAVTMGGSGDLIPGASGSGIDEWIDPGDWFKGVTGAIRHYGESMVEYPKGCILVLKQVFEHRLIVPGKDYVIETAENRVTKKVQLGADNTYIRLHSTNNETYPDGTLIHQPYNVLIDDIRRMFEVLGYVVKKGGGTMVYTNQN